MNKKEQNFSFTCYFKHSDWRTINTHKNIINLLFDVETSVYNMSYNISE